MHLPQSPTQDAVQALSIFKGNRLYFCGQPSQYTTDFIRHIFEVFAILIKATCL